MLSRSLFLVSYLASISLAVATTTVHASLSSASTTLAKTQATVTSATRNISSSEPTATDIRGDLSFSLKDQPINVPELPAHVNLTCIDCTTTGSLEVAAGGYNASAEKLDIAEQFFEHGFIELEAHDVSANFVIDIALHPGFQAAHFKFPLFHRCLFNVSMGKLANMEICFDIFVPVDLILNSEVDVKPSLNLHVPDGSKLYLDFGTPENTFISGFNQSTMKPSLDITAPNLAFNITTGLEYVLTAEMQLSSNATSDVVDIGGHIIASLGLPLLNTTLAEVHNVNSSCMVPAPGSKDKIMDTAYDVQFLAATDLNIDGGLEFEILDTGFSWAPPVLETFNHTLPLPPACFIFDQKHNGLTEVGGEASTSDKQSAAATLAPRVFSGASTLAFVILVVGAVTL